MPLYRIHYQQAGFVRLHGPNPWRSLSLAQLTNCSCSWYLHEEDVGNVELPDVMFTAELHTLPEDLLHLLVVPHVPVHPCLRHQDRNIAGEEGGGEGREEGGKEGEEGEEGEGGEGGESMILGDSQLPGA